MDVGQGLAVAVETSNHVLVFDAGPAWSGGGTAAQFSLLPLLRARGLRAVDRLVLSHDDQDHAGGAKRLQTALRVRRVMRSGDCRRGDSWRWDRVEFLVLHPAPGFPGSDNDRSCAILAAGRGGRALLLGDPESAAEAELHRQAIAADVVLLPHHGSRSSSGAALVAAVSARYGIASAGFGNRWGMPHREVVARWRAAGTTVFSTAQEGAVRARFPPGAGPIEIHTARRDEPRWWRAKPAG